jgi:peptide-methionine (R)-S-oxide reductase
MTNRLNHHRIAGLSIAALLASLGVPGCGSAGTDTTTTSPPPRIQAKSPTPKPPTDTPTVATTVAPASEGTMQETAMSTPDTSTTTAAAAAAAKLTKSEDEWKRTLTAKQFDILRQKGTERAFSGEHWNTPASSGEYRCAACDSLLFKGSDKFVSDCGWPAFDKAIKGSIEYHTDRSFGMVRTEVTCAHCGGHLGHVFEDGPTDTATRYCINSVSIKYVKDGSASKDKPTEAIVEEQKK